MVESINNVVSLNRNYIERDRDIPLYTNRVWGPRTEYAHPQVQEGYLLDTPANREIIRQRELVERYNLANLEGLQDVPRYLNTQATTMDTEASVNTERLRQLQELLRATEDADATETAIRFAENYF